MYKLYRNHPMLTNAILGVCWLVFWLCFVLVLTGCNTKQRVMNDVGSASVTASEIAAEARTIKLQADELAVFGGAADDPFLVGESGENRGLSDIDRNESDQRRTIIERHAEDYRNRIEEQSSGVGCDQAGSVGDRSGLFDDSSNLLGDRKLGTASFQSPRLVSEAVRIDGSTSRREINLGTTRRNTTEPSSANRNTKTDGSSVSSSIPSRNSNRSKQRSQDMILATIGDAFFSILLAVVLVVGVLMIPVGSFLLGLVFGSKVKKEMMSLVDRIDGNYPSNTQAPNNAPVQSNGVGIGVPPR